MTEAAPVSRAGGPPPPVAEPSPLLGTVLGFATFGALGLVVSFLVMAEPDSGRSHAWPVTFAIMLLSAVRLSMVVAAGQRRMFEFIFWLFCYVFFGLAPTVQMRLDDMPGTTLDLDPVLDLPTALLALGGVLGIGLGFAIANRRASRRAGGELPSPEWTYELNGPGLVALTGVGLLLAAYYVAKVGPSTLVSSRVGSSTIEDTLWPDPSVAGIVRAGSSFPILIAAHGWWSLSRRVAWRRPAKLVAAVLTAVTMAVTNPISSSRYASGVVWGSFVGPAGAYTTARRLAGTMVGIVGGLLFLFPLADLFRRVNTVNASRTGFLAEYAGNGDYDAFGQLSNALLYDRTMPLAFGRQLMGQLLFFVPRSIWTDKPTGTGVLLAQFRGYRFTNLSAPIWAELLLNFGIIGVLVGSVLIGLGLGRLDEAFRRRTQSSTVVIASAVLPFYLLIVLRGSLLQATGSLVVIVGSLLIISRRTRAVRGP